jgi:hypothetical protein
MKKLTLSLLMSLGLVGSTFAGQEMASGKEYKGGPEPITCFKDQELQLDIFGAYADGNRPHAGQFDEHAVGGGVGINYFFHRNIGVGVDATWLYGGEKNGGDHSNDGNTTYHNFTSSLIFRFPIDEICLAPYVFVGGGFHVDGDQWASAHAGVGLEYRIVPERIGIFTDARFTYFGDRYGDGDQNNIMARAGVRFVF